MRGIAEIEFDLCPIFIDGSLDVLWGRLDLMTANKVEIEEREERFSLTPLLPDQVSG